LAGDPEALHRDVTAFLGSSRGEAAALFRMDEVTGGFDLLILAPERPSFERMPWEVRDLRCAPAAKPFAPVLREGDRLAFRLLARPGKRHASGEAKGKRQDLRTDEERLDWLRRKGETSGFRVVSCGLTLLTYGAVKEDGGLSRARRKVDGRWVTERGTSFQAVRFDGELVVVDPAAFVASLPEGFGPGKAYGFGLLTVARVGG
jgi:CRISPR system Cascade subunit CasE